MNVTSTFICGLDQLTLPSTPARGERFSDNYFITTDPSKISDLIKSFGDALGTAEFNYLTSRTSALAYRVSATSLDGHDLGQALQAQLVTDMLAVKRLELGFWLVKNNASHFDRAWISAPSGSGWVVHNNTWGARMSSAGGDYDRAAFSSEDLRFARSLNTPKPLYLDQGGPPTMLGTGSLRFQRFQYFIGAARATVDVAMKIAQYCSALEALVSTAQQELSHQVSERVAVLLALRGEDRLKMYRLVKQAYGYRSKTVHGASFKEADMNKLRDCSTAIDGICRHLYLMYLEDDAVLSSAVESSDEIATAFFLAKLLGESDVSARS